MKTLTKLRYLPPSGGVQAGISLIEIMVGMVVGMIAVTVMLNLFANTEGRKRLTSATADTQINGQIALVSIERDVRNAGLGLSSTGCNGILIYNVNFPPPSTMSLSGLPVEITANGSDQTITLMTSTDSLSVYKTKVEAWNLASAELDVENAIGFDMAYEASTSANRPLAMINQGGNCAVVQITQAQVNPNKVQHNSGIQAPYNASQAATFFTDNGFTATGAATLSMFGQMETYRYSLNTVANVLEVTNLTPLSGGATTDQLVYGVVALRAEYGLDLDGDGVLDGFYPHDDASVPSPLLPTHMMAVRVALVVRASHYDKDYDTASISWWESGTANTLNFSNDDRHYRYRVFESVIPLRNPIWNLP